jgi:hypothetical protein
LNQSQPTGTRGARQRRGPALLIRFSPDGEAAVYVEADNLAEQRDLQRRGDVVARVLEVLRNAER